MGYIGWLAVTVGYIKRTRNQHIAPMYIRTKSFRSLSSTNTPNIQISTDSFIQLRKLIISTHKYIMILKCKRTTIQNHQHTTRQLLYNMRPLLTFWGLFGVYNIAGLAIYLFSELLQTKRTLSIFYIDILALYIILVQAKGFFWSCCSKWLINIS